MNPIIDTIKLINKSGANSTSVTITSFSLFNLIPFKIDYYYRFDGSSTAPPCAENVDWFVVLYPSLSVSSKQSAQLQLMLDQNNQKVWELDLFSLYFCKYKYIYFSITKRYKLMWDHCKILQIAQWPNHSNRFIDFSWDSFIT